MKERWVRVRVSSLDVRDDIKAQEAYERTRQRGWIASMVVRPELPTPPGAIVWGPSAPGRVWP